MSRDVHGQIKVSVSCDVGHFDEAFKDSPEPQTFLPALSAVIVVRPGNILQVLA